MVELLKKYGRIKDIVWCQEEPKNQGCWYVLRDKIEACLHHGQKLSYVGRSKMAAPASGVYRQHVMEQDSLLIQALEVD